MTTALRCPACGATEIKVSEETCVHEVPYAEPATVVETIHECELCGETGDFSGENDAKFTETERSAVKSSIANMLAHLASNGYTLAYLERAFGLPQRTMNRWKVGECSASGVALLRVIRTYPWLAEVADARFAELVANKVLVREAASVLGNAAGLGPRVYVLSAFGGNLEIDVDAKYHTTLEMPADPSRPEFKIVMAGSDQNVAH